MLGLPAQKVTLSHSDWLARLHPEDREIYRDALSCFVTRPGRHSAWNSAPAAQDGQWRWLELRASIVTEQDVPSDCLGLLATSPTARNRVSEARPDAAIRPCCAIP